MNKLMKKTLVAIYILMLGVLLTACSSCEPADFISFDDNLLLTFDVDGPNPFTFTIFNAYTTDNRLQRRVTPEGSQDDRTRVELLEIQNGDLVLIDLLVPFFENVDITGHSPFFHDQVLMGPIELGATWLRNPFDPPDAHEMREITGVDVSITTPAGTFNAIEVTSFPPYDPDFLIQPRTKDFFARDVGVVKSVSHSGLTHDAVMSGIEEETIITVRLIDIQRRELVEMGLVFFQLDGEWQFTYVDVAYSTNNDLTQATEHVLRKTLELAFGHDSQAAINFAILHQDTRALNLDLDAAFLAEMAQAADEAQERDIINAVVTAFGALFNAESVRITVDGQPYNGVFVSLGAAEFIPMGRGVLWE